MVDDSRGIRKSKFPAQTSILSGATFDYVQGGVNHKISSTDMIAAFGTVGTIQQEGLGTDTPILDDQGTVKGIRNLHAGQGILTGIDANNSAEIKSGIKQDGTGTPMFDNVTLNEPTMASLLAGTGMQIVKTGNEIELTVTGITPVANRVVVNQLSDFPTPSGGVITLADDTEYFVTNKLSTSDRFVIQNNTWLHGSDSSISGLTYTGTGTMFTSADASNKISRIELICATGTLFDISATIPGFVFQFIDATVTSCDCIGTMDDITASQITDINFANVITDGLTFSGSQSIFLSVRSLYTIAAGSVYDFGSSVFSGGISITDSFATLNGSSVFLDGATASANLATGALGSLVNTRLSGTGTPLNNISVDDIRWQFALNDDIQDTKQDALIDLSLNATETVISTINTPVLVAGTWAQDAASQFSTDAAGRITYNGEKNVPAPIDISFTVKGASGGSKQWTGYLAVNGTVETKTRLTVTASSSQAAAGNVVWQRLMTTGDFVEFFIENNTDTTNAVVTDSVFRVN